jgi:transcription initiation factor TFIIIB Brf1 subunit/transcription initiation factor TFIIB
MKKICPECGSKKIERKSNTEYCKKCGLVLSEILV